MREKSITGGYLRRFRLGFFLSILLLLMASTVWAAPTVTAFQPENGSTQPVSITATATFSEAMDPATITTGSFTISRPVRITAIAAGGDNTVVVRDDGTVAAWGNNAFGKSTVPADLSGVVAVATRGGRTVALKNDGMVVAWGYNGQGQCTVPADLSGVVAIAAGLMHTVALKGDGTVVAWGDNYNGQSTVPAGLYGVVAIAAGDYHTVALKNDGTVVAWGYNNQGQCTAPAGLSGVKAIAAGNLFTVALKNDGTVVGWGFNGWGQTTVPAGLSGVKAIAAGHYHTVALKGDGTVIGWGRNDEGQCTAPAGLSGVTAISADGLRTMALKDDGTMVGWGQNLSFANTVPMPPSGVKAIAAGGWHVVALKADSTVVAWGQAPEGAVPEDLSGVTAIAAGGMHTVALKGNGTVVAWGNNKWNQTMVPAGLSGVTAIAAGWLHSAVLKENGTVVAWGSNQYGQTTVPAGLAGVTAIATGYNHTMALMGDGTVVAWGDNSYGQTTVPAGLAGVAAIAGGYYHTVALKGDGTVVAWGSNNDGQTTVPAGLSGVVAIAAGQYYTVALKGDGTVVAWGGNGNRPVPADLSGVVAIAAKGWYSVALKPDGTAVAWGDNTVLSASPYEIPVDGTVVYDQVTDTVTFTPSSPLKPLSTYLATVNTGARSAGDAHLAADVTWSFTTEKAPATVTLSGLYQTYDGDPKAITATTEPAGLTVDITYNGSPAAPTNAGSYTVVATIDDPYYGGSISDTLTIAKASAQFNFVGLEQTFDDTPKAVTATTIPAGLAFALTYNGSPTAPTNAGSYTVAATITDPNYQGSANVTLNVAKAAATVTLVGLNQTYDGTSKTVTATTTPVGLAVDILYDVNATNAGSYPVDAIVTDANYQGSASDTLVIAKADQTIIFSPEPPATLRKQDTYNLVATAASPLPVVFTVTSGPGVINGTLLSFTSNGTVVITASHAGDSNYNAAPDEQRTIIVTNK